MIGISAPSAAGSAKTSNSKQVARAVLIFGDIRISISVTRLSNVGLDIPTLVSGKLGRFKIHRTGRYGSEAVPQNSTIPEAAIGGKAAIQPAILKSR